MANAPLLIEPNYGNGGMNFLQLLQALQRESSTSGTVPSTCQNQVGDFARLVNWLAAAWMDIQNQRPDWFFMQQPVQFNTVTGQSSYTAAQAGLTSFANYKINAFRQYNPALGYGSEQRLNFMTYESFRDMYQYASMRTTQAMPVVFTVDYSKNFLLGPIPDQVYVVNGLAYAQPTALVNDTDTPTMPPQYHMAIVWRALMYYGQFEAAPEAYSHGQNEYTRLMDRLLADQLPVIGFGEPLA